jgi:hypothetical protein
MLRRAVSWKLTKFQRCKQSVIRAFETSINFYRLHGVTSQETVIVILAAVRN